MRRLIVVLAAASVLVTGCGGGGKSSGEPLTKAEYQTKLEQIAKDVGARLQSTTSTSKKPTKEDVAAAEKALNEFAGELGKVTPPAEVEQAHKDLITAMRRLGNDLEGILKKTSEAKDASAAITALVGAPAIQLLLKAQQEFKAKGYDLNLT